MHKGIIIVLIVTCLGACSSESPDSNKNMSNQSEPKSANVQKAKEAAEWTFCNCLESGQSPKDCEAKGMELFDANFLIDNECFDRPDLEKAARDMCDCINNIQQVSLKCDELQRQFDETFSNSEQAIIQAYFDRMDCSE